MSDDNTQPIHARLSKGVIVHLKDACAEPVALDHVEGRVGAVDVSYLEADVRIVRSLDVTFLDGDKTVILAVPLDSETARDLLNRLAAVKDFSTPVRVSACLREGADGRERGGVTLHADGREVAPAYAPDLIPAVRRVRLNGKAYPDSDDRDRFYGKLYVSVKERVGSAAAELR